MMPFRRHRTVRPADKVALLALTVLISGCEHATRACGEFNHPAAAEFSTVEVGDSMRFAATNGAVVDFELLSIENNDPYTTSERGASAASEVECRLESVHAFHSRELDLDLTLTFDQRDRVGVEPADQGLILDLLFRKPGTSARSGLSFILSDYTAEFEGDALIAGRYDDTRQLGQTIFSEVAERTMSSELPVFDRTQDPAEVRVFRMALSRGIGLAQYEQVDGTVYTRLLP